MMYNEAYKEVAGNKHPELMGTGFSGPFSEIWDGLGPIFRGCAKTGKSVRMENDRLFIERCVMCLRVSRGRLESVEVTEISSLISSQMRISRGNVLQLVFRSIVRRHRSHTRFLQRPFRDHTSNYQ